MDKYGKTGIWSQVPRFGYAIETLELARNAIRIAPCRELRGGIPSSYSLGSLYQYLTGEMLSSAHRAEADVIATTRIFLHKLFWPYRGMSLFQFRKIPTIESPSTIQANVQYDSDSAESSAGSLSSDSNSLNSSIAELTINQEEPMGDVWEVDTDFEPTIPTPIQKFEESFTRRSTRIKSGLQCSPSSVNTPSKAWRQIFTNSILDKIVGYTNEYGEATAKTWTTVCRSDLIDFISILFLSSIQKRKDKPSNWFSNNPLLEFPAAKKITSGRKFLTMLRYLHCCSMEDQPTGEDYDPSYKVAELKEYLEKRYERLFHPFQQLSLDETLIRSFGRMKFKVRIVTKAARYGIKVYVITDAATSFVLRVLIYTGKYTYYESVDESMKKTVQVVRSLCQPYVGTHRTVYIDRFYTSIDLLKELEKMDLYITGTVMKNRVPQNLRIAKTSQTFKTMSRGDFKKHRLKFKTSDGEDQFAGLVCWRDRDIVYCLSNDTGNIESDTCHRRSKDGLIVIQRPLVISRYNKYMGGVDVADMCRLHCNSTIMGQNRWWLKLFFYLLDVGTSNALVLYNETRKAQDQKMNIVDFKMKLVEGFVGNKVGSTCANENQSAEPKHIPERSASRHRCAYCSLFSEFRRTRYRCQACNVPLCMLGTGCVEQDCFTKAHETETTRQMVLRKYEVMKKTTNERCNS